jgi:hypothetical protein
MNIADQFSRSRQPPPPQLQAQTPRSQPPPQPQEVDPSLAEVVTGGAPQQAGTAQRRTRTAPSQGQVVQQQIRTPRDLAKAIVADAAWPDDMKSQQWVFLLTTLHSDRPIDKIGEEIAMMLEGMMKTERLAEVLHPMFDEDGPAPSAILRQVFAPLPIAQPDHAERYEAILANIDEHYTDVEEADEDSGPDTLQRKADISADAQAAVAPNGSAPLEPTGDIEGALTTA